MRISEILSDRTATPVTIGPEETLRDAARLLAEHRIGILPVCKSDGVLGGVLSERDIVAALSEHGNKAAGLSVADVMTAKVEVCAPSEFAAEILERMNKGKFRHMPVVLNDKLLGIVSIRDVLSKLQNDAAMDRDKLYNAGLSWL